MTQPTFTNKRGLSVDFDPTAKLEIEIRTNRWSTVTADMFRSWAGNRKINGRPYAGPVYFLWTNQVSTLVEQTQNA